MSFGRIQLVKWHADKLTNTDTVIRRTHYLQPAPIILLVMMAWDIVTKFEFYALDEKVTF